MNDLLKLLSAATRRGFLKTTGAASLALAAPPLGGEASAEMLQSNQVRLTINGRGYDLDLEAPGSARGAR